MFYDGHTLVSIEEFSPFVERRACAYDPETEVLEDRQVMLHGFYQSWRYFANIPRRQLVDHFRFTQRTSTAADQSRVWRDLARTTLTGSDSILVGVHVRRGDFVRSPSTVAYGYTVADRDFFRRAMRYFADRFKRVDFVVCSDDIEWSRRNVLLPPVTSHRCEMRIAYCDGSDDEAADLAVLARADHVIMSTGTFGWWAAWLAGGTTIYYGGWPRPGSALSAQVNKTDFFPPDWIAM